MTDAERRKLLARATKRLKMTTEGYNKVGGHWRAAMALLDDLDNDLKPDPPPTVPPLGPVTVGGQSLLKMSLTHQTSGLPLYPALDTAWVAGQKVLAPESGVVTRHSGNSNGGYSVYITGASGLRYYSTHLKDAGRHGLGAIGKGSTIGYVGSPKQFPAQRVAHTHFGVNAEDLLGQGHQLKYGAKGNGPDYTNGAPSIGEQLAKL
jgi:murein DD-endopeptidase MepM/ murein hydrolase activator NlpD